MIMIIVRTISPAVNQYFYFKNSRFTVSVQLLDRYNAARISNALLYRVLTDLPMQRADRNFRMMASYRYFI